MGSFSLASDLCQSILKSKPQWDLVKSLYCFSLGRSNKLIEAKMVALDLLKSQPKSPEVLTPLNLSLQDLKCCMSIISCVILE